MGRYLSEGFPRSSTRTETPGAGSGEIEICGMLEVDLCTYPAERNIGACYMIPNVEFARRRITISTCCLAMRDDILGEMDTGQHGAGCPSAPPPPLRLPRDGNNSVRHHDT